MFDKNADIVEVPDDTTISAKGFAFLPSLKELITIDPQRKVVDVVAILHHIGPVLEVTTKLG